MTLSHFFFHILEYLEATQNSLAAHYRNPKKRWHRLPRLWWRCQKARSTMVNWLKFSSKWRFGHETTEFQSWKLDMNLNFPLSPTFLLAKAYCFEATYWGIALLNNLENLSPSCKVLALTDTFHLGGDEDWRERCWIPQQKAQSGQVREGTKDGHP